jgi:calcineurin-like phosphoesterase family protein
VTVASCCGGRSSWIELDPVGAGVSEFQRVRSHRAHGLDIVSFAHYPWNVEEDGRAGQFDDVRIHGHIHNNGYTRNGFVPFLRNHINLSVEQTKYRPVNLKLLLDAALLGKYDPTTDEQMQEVRNRRKENLT